MSKHTPADAIETFEREVYAYFDADACMPMLIYKGVTMDFIDNASDILNAVMYDAFGEICGNAGSISAIIKVHAYTNQQHTYPRAAIIDDALHYRLDNTHEVVVDRAGWYIRRIDVRDIIYRACPDSEDHGIPEHTDSDLTLFDLIDHLPLSRSGKILLMGTMVHSFLPYPHPVVNIVAEQGSGKSTLITYIRKVLDPIVGDGVDIVPTKMHDLQIAMSKHMLFVFDNVSTLSDDMSNLIAQASTNGNVILRALYTTAGILRLPLRNTVLIGGVVDVMRRPDILSRTIKLELPPLTEVGSSDVLFIRPTIVSETLEAIFDTVSHILNRPKVRECAPSRLSEYYWVTVATAELCGISREEVDRAFEENDVLVAEQAVESSYIGAWLCEKLRVGGSIEMTATELLKEMTNNPIPNRPCTFKSATSLGMALGGIMKPLASLGFSYERRPGRARLNIITRHAID